MCMYLKMFLLSGALRVHRLIIPGSSDIASKKSVEMTDSPRDFDNETIDTVLRSSDHVKF